MYRAGGAEVFVVRGPRGELDVPGVRGIVLELAPERGEMVVDLDALALDAAGAPRRPARTDAPKRARPGRAAPQAARPPTPRARPVDADRRGPSPPS